MAAAEQRNVIKFNTMLELNVRGADKKQKFPPIPPALFKILESIESSNIKTCSTSLESAFEVSWKKMDWLKHVTAEEW